MSTARFEKTERAFTLRYMSEFHGFIARVYLVLPRSA